MRTWLNQYRIVLTVKNVLFLCSGNSARSQIAEAVLNIKGAGRFQGYSAGIHPSGLINPFAVQLIDAIGYPSHTLRSKRWVEFVMDGAPVLDFVISLSEDTRHMAHPIWPGNPILAKWAIQDPTVTVGSIAHKKAIFQKATAQINHCIDNLLVFPSEHFDRSIIEQEINSFDFLWQDRTPLVDGKEEACDF